jgi:hypothetical protein
MHMLRNMSTLEHAPRGSRINQEVLDSLSSEFKQRFDELVQQAELELMGRSFIFSRYGRELYPYFENQDSSPSPGCIIPNKKGRPVASVDSTCVLVGETSGGALYAARAVIGLSFEGSLRRFFRLGPILAFASPSGLSGVGSKLNSAELDLLMSDHAVAERVIRNALERRVVDVLMEEDDDMIVMADGSLKHPMGSFSKSLPHGASGKVLVGFSKSSNLIFSEGAVCALSRSPTPSYCLVDQGMVNTVLAKFSPDGMVFRLDLAVPSGSIPEVLGSILFNDAFASGYPDSLKIAHHLSVFSRAEAQALKAYVTKRFRVRQMPTFPLRTVALGSFKGGA